MAQLRYAASQETAHVKTGHTAGMLMPLRCLRSMRYSRRMADACRAPNESRHLVLSGRHGIWRCGRDATGSRSAAWIVSRNTTHLKCTAQRYNAPSDKTSSRNTEKLHLAYRAPLHFGGGRAGKISKQELWSICVKRSQAPACDET
jgi:hypothetical protein